MDSKYKALQLCHQLCFPLYAASREIIKQYRPFLEELNLTYTQYIVMSIIWDVKTINVKELGNILFLDSGTLTPVLKSLENKGFINRHRSSMDERVLIVDVTDSGLELREKSLDIPVKMSEYNVLTADETSLMHSLLYKILNSCK